MFVIVAAVSSRVCDCCSSSPTCWCLLQQLAQVLVFTSAVRLRVDVCCINQRQHAVLMKGAVSRRVLLKHRVNWSAVCDAIGVLPWRSIWSADNPVERLNVHLSQLVERFVPTKVIRVRNKDKP